VLVVGAPYDAEAALAEPCEQAVAAKHERRRTTAAGPARARRSAARGRRPVTRRAIPSWQR
jgi:hypothetical protein